MSAITINSREAMWLLKSEPIVKGSVIAVALAGIACLTLCLLGHMNMLTGWNAWVQSTLPPISAGFAVVSVLGALALLTRPETTQYAQDPAALKVELDRLCRHLIDAIDLEDPVSSIQRLAEQIPLDTLEKTVHAAFANQRTALETSKLMLGQAEFYLSAVQHKSPSWRACASDVIDTFLEFFDSLFAAFGVADFLKPTENEFHADFKFQKIMMLISFFILLTSTLLPLLGYTTGASVVGGIFLFLSLGSVIWPAIRPRSSKVPEGENWFKQQEMGKMIPPLGRIQEANAIREGLRRGQPLLMLGPTGIGKKLTLQAFIEAKKNYPELADKVVVYYNMADLVNCYDLFGYGNTILKRIYETIKHDPQGFIHVFDNVALAYQERAGSDLGSQLRSFFDPKPENTFPLVIGLANDEEYEKYIYSTRSADDRRLENKVYIQDVSKKEALAIYRREAFKTAPYVVFETRALKFLYDQTKSCPQPLFGLKILSRCLKKIQILRTSLDKTIEETKELLLTLHSKAAEEGSAFNVKEVDLFSEIAPLESELTTQLGQLDTQKEALDKLALARTALAKARAVKYQAIKDTAQLDKDNLSSCDQVKLVELMLIKYFLEAPLEQATQLEGMHTTLSIALIKQALTDEKADQEKHAQTITQAREKQEKRKISPHAPAKKPDQTH